MTEKNSYKHACPDCVAIMIDKTDDNPAITGQRFDEEKEYLEHFGECQTCFILRERLPADRKLGLSLDEKERDCLCEKGRELYDNLQKKWDENWGMLRFLNCISIICNESVTEARKEWAAERLLEEHFRKYYVFFKGWKKDKEGRLFYVNSWETLKRDVFENQAFFKEEEFGETISKRKGVCNLKYRPRACRAILEIFSHYNKKTKTVVLGVGVRTKKSTSERTAKFKAQFEADFAKVMKIAMKRQIFQSIKKSLVPDHRLSEGNDVKENERYCVDTIPSKESTVEEILEYKELIDKLTYILTPRELEAINSRLMGKTLTDNQRQALSRLKKKSIYNRLLKIKSRHISID